MPKKLKRVKLYTSDDCSAWVFGEYVDAKTGVEFDVTLNRHFVGKSKRGLPWECLLVYAIRHAVKENSKLFPHRFLDAYVIGTTVYIIEHHPMRGNQVVRCVRYMHSFTKVLRKFDRFTKRTFLKHFGDEGCHVRLRPPSADPRRAHGERSQKASREDGSRTRKLEGAHQRAMEAGIIARTKGRTEQATWQS